MLHSELSQRIIQACFQVHNELGPGFLESVYERALIIALDEMGLNTESQIGLTVWFRGRPVGEFVADLFVERQIIVELKAAKAITPEFQAQAINYLKATRIEVGLIVNFGAPRVEIRRVYSPVQRPKGAEGPAVEVVHA